MFHWILESAPSKDFTVKFKKKSIERFKLQILCDQITDADILFILRKLKDKLRIYFLLAAAMFKLL